MENIISEDHYEEVKEHVFSAKIYDVQIKSRNK